MYKNTVIVYIKNKVTTLGLKAEIFDVAISHETYYKTVKERPETVLPNIRVLFVKIVISSDTRRN